MLLLLFNSGSDAIVTPPTTTPGTGATRRRFMSTFDKLSTVNTALLRTGNNPAQYEGDGSDEWLSGSDAYDTNLPVVLYHHDWGFASQIEELQRAGDSPLPTYDDEYYKPVDALHIEQVWLNEQPAAYQIVNNRIQINGQGYAPLCRYIAQPTADQFPAQFLEALRLLVMSAIYRGLNEDERAADGAYKMAMDMLAGAKTRADQEVPARSHFQSRLLLARRTRRIRSFISGSR